MQGLSTSHKTQILYLVSQLSHHQLSLMQLENLENHLPQQQEIQSIGSGVIIDSQNGFILTNFHVVKDAEVINVALFDERKSEATLIGYDEKTDLAILQIQEEALFQFDISKKTKISLGDYVLAIGNPFGLGHTVTYGIVSGINSSNVGIIKGNE